MWNKPILFISIYKYQYCGQIFCMLLKCKRKKSGNSATNSWKFAIIYFYFFFVEKPLSVLFICYFIFIYFLWPPSYACTYHIKSWTNYQKSFSFAFLLLFVWNLHQQEKREYDSHWQRTISFKQIDIFDFVENYESKIFFLKYQCKLIRGQFIYTKKKCFF